MNLKNLNLFFVFSLSILLMAKAEEAVAEEKQIENPFEFLPNNNGQTKFVISEVKCNESPTNATEIIGNCIGDITLDLEVFQIPYKMKVIFNLF